MFDEKRYRPLGWLLIFVGLALMLACNVANELISPDSEPTATGEPAVAATALTTTVSSAVGLAGGEINGPGDLTLIFPEGALPADVPVNIAVVAPPPADPSGAITAGTAYQVDLPPGTELLFPVEAILPLERQPGLADENYAAYRWDGEGWFYLGGIVEGDTLRVQVDQFSILRIYGLSTTHRPVMFVNWSANKAWVFPWTWQTGESNRYGHAYAFTTVPGGDVWPGATWAYQSYPMGTYFTWCIQWDEWTQPVWDLGGGGFYSEYRGTYHFFLDYPITLNRESPGGGLREMERVEFTLQARIDGQCGYPPGEIPRAEETPQPGVATETGTAAAGAPATSAVAAGTATSPAGGTASPTDIATATATIAATGTPTPVKLAPPTDGAPGPGGLSTRVLGGNLRTYSVIPDIIASANTQEYLAPAGISISYSEGTTPWVENRILWEEGDWVQATTSLDISAMGVQILGDYTIGWAAVYFDGQEVWRGNAATFWDDGYVHALYVEVSGFEPGEHTLRVVSLGLQGKEPGGRSIPVPYFGLSYEGVAQP